MKIYRDQNVYEAALDRIRWVFNEFDNVMVSYSGGKDSTVTLRLALEVAREQGKLPLPVMWLDQEIEWQATTDHVREVMYEPEVKPMWMQFPFVISNATSPTARYLDCWAEDKQDQWVHPRDPIAYTENKYDEVRFHKLFGRILQVEFPEGLTANLAGVRCEESPARQGGLTNKATYKHITWGKKVTKQHYNLYPLYDWTTSDIWKAIHDHDWPYCTIYDQFYRYGVTLPKMRVSNLNHETSLESLLIAHEIEPDTWNRVQARLQGTNTAKQLGTKMMEVPELPFMFDDWKEYREYLLEKLITEPEVVKVFRKMFDNHDRRFERMLQKEHLWKHHVRALLLNDLEAVTVNNFFVRPHTIDLLRFWKGSRHRNNLTNPFIDWSREDETPPLPKFAELGAELRAIKNPTANRSHSRPRIS